MNRLVVFLITWGIMGPVIAVQAQWWREHAPFFTSAGGSVDIAEFVKITKGRDRWETVKTFELVHNNDEQQVSYLSFYPHHPEGFRDLATGNLLKATGETIFFERSYGRASNFPEIEVPLDWFVGTSYEEVLHVYNHGWTWITNNFNGTTTEKEREGAPFHNGTSVVVVGNRKFVSQFSGQAMFINLTETWWRCKLLVLGTANGGRRPVVATQWVTIGPNQDVRASLKIPEGCSVARYYGKSWIGPMASKPEE